MNPSSDPSISSPAPASKKPSLYPPEPTHNPSIAPPFSKPPSFESMTSTLQPTPSEQDATAAANKPTHPHHRPTLSSEYSSNHPFSAFYSHPTTRTSLEQAKSASSKLNVHVYEHVDLESQSGLTTNTTNTTSHHQDQNHDNSPTTTPSSTYTATPEKTHHRPKRISTMWLSIPRCAAHLTTGASSKKRHNVRGTVRGSRACAPYRRLSRAQKWVVQILLAVVVVGAATALGVGISKAVGAGVWKSDTSTSPIGDVA